MGDVYPGFLTPKLAVPAVVEGRGHYMTTDDKVFIAEEPSTPGTHCYSRMLAEHVSFLLS